MDIVDYYVHPFVCPAGNSDTTLSTKFNEVLVTA